MNSRTIVSEMEALIPASASPRIYRLKQRDNLFTIAFDVMKIVPAAGMINAALKSGELEPGGAVVESSSGTLALGLGLVCQSAGLRLSIVTDGSIDEALRQRLRSLGVNVEIVEANINSADVQTLRLQRLARLLEVEPGAFWPRQYENPQNGLSYRGVAELILEQLGVVDTLVVAVGSGGSSAGISRCLRDANPRMRLVGVDTHGSVIFGLPKRSRYLRGLGSSLVPPNVQHNLFDRVHWVDAATAFLAARQLQASEGLFYGPTSGATWLVGLHELSVNRDQRVVCVFPDSGHRYVDTAFNPAWCLAHGLTADAMPLGPAVVTKLSDVSELWTAMDWNRRSLEDALTGPVS